MEVSCAPRLGVAAQRALGDLLGLALLCGCAVNTAVLPAALQRMGSCTDVCRCWLAHTRDVSECWDVSGEVGAERGCFVSSVEVWKSLFDFFFFKSDQLFHVSMFTTVPSPLRTDWWVTGQLLPWPVSMGANMTRKGSVLERK